MDAAALVKAKACKGKLRNPTKLDPALELCSMSGHMPLIDRYLSQNESLTALAAPINADNILDGVFLAHRCGLWQEIGNRPLPPVESAYHQQALHDRNWLIHAAISARRQGRGARIEARRAAAILATAPHTASQSSSKGKGRGEGCDIPEAEGQDYSPKGQGRGEGHDIPEAEGKGYSPEGKGTGQIQSKGRKGKNKG